MALTKRKKKWILALPQREAALQEESLRGDQKQRAWVADSGVYRREPQKKVPVPAESPRLSSSLHLWESQDRPGYASATPPHFLTTRKFPFFLTNAIFPAWASEAGPPQALRD